MVESNFLSKDGSHELRDLTNLQLTHRPPRTSSSSSSSSSSASSTLPSNPQSKSFSVIREEILNSSTRLSHGSEVGNQPKNEEMEVELLYSISPTRNDTGAMGRDLVVSICEGKEVSNDLESRIRCSEILRRLLDLDKNHIYREIAMSEGRRVVDYIPKLERIRYKKLAASKYIELVREIIVDSSKYPEVIEEADALGCDELGMCVIITFSFLQNKHLNIYTRPYISNCISKLSHLNHHYLSGYS